MEDAFTEYSNEIMKIVEGAFRSDQEKVVNYTNLLVKKLEQDGEIRLAASFSKIINGNLSKMTQKSMTDLVKVPLDQESRLPMADITSPNQLVDTKVVLNRSAKEQIDKFLEYHSNSNKLIGAGIKIPNTILLYGPPGCGKSKLADHISHKTGLPLVVARIDGLISSYLGSTAKNIRAIFDYAQTVPCVLFLDEFDAIAKIRNDDNELGELKRVVNSLLQNMDKLQSGSIIIAATNHEQLLDSAVWRRFSFRVLIERPDKGSIKELIFSFLGERLTDKEMLLLVTAFEGLTGAEVEEICQKASIDSILSENKLNLKCVFNAYFDLKKTSRNCNTAKDINTARARHLRSIDEKIFSYGAISEILGLSKSHVSYLINRTED